ncbi:MAG: hypothetical protein O2839_09765 [Cyanobacteria bacterium]|nr:hypothetical protein [Cyanobacteriota bacterium]
MATNSLSIYFSMWQALITLAVAVLVQPTEQAFALLPQRVDEFSNCGCIWMKLEFQVDTLSWSEWF